MTDKPPPDPSDDTGLRRDLAADTAGHIPASESDDAIVSPNSTDQRDTHLPASEREKLAQSDEGERILERGLTRLPPG